MKGVPGGISDSDHRQQLLDLWKEMGGFYSRPLDNPDAPLVGYAGTYKDGDSSDCQYVGDLYANFAPVEADNVALDEYAKALADRVRDYYGDPIAPHYTAVLGVMMGSVRLSWVVGHHLGVKSPYAEKLPAEAGFRGQRGKEVLQMSRHVIKPGARILICEDVLNNFSTTAKLIELVEEAGASVVAIIAALNRSADGVLMYAHGDTRIPVLSALHLPTPQYKQDDPYVADLIEQELVVWKAKEKWDKLVPFI